MHANSYFMLSFSRGSMSIVDFYWHVDLWIEDHGVASVHKKLKILCISVCARKNSKLICLSNQETETVLCNLSDKSLPTNRLS